MIETAYGVVSTDETGTEVYGEFAHLYSWATRPNQAWPGAELANLDSISAKFDSRGDLVDLKVAYDGRPVGIVIIGLDIDSAELNAWSSDVLRAAGMTDHPAIRNAVTA